MSELHELCEPSVRVRTFGPDAYWASAGSPTFHMLVVGPPWRAVRDDRGVVIESDASCVIPGNSPGRLFVGVLMAAGTP
jgi:hypothetical protein